MRQDEGVSSASTASNPLVIEFDMAGPELQAKIAAEMNAAGAQGFPFVKIGGHVVKGYAPDEFDRLLETG